MKKFWSVIEPMLPTYIGICTTLAGAVMGTLSFYTFNDRAGTFWFTLCAVGVYIVMCEAYDMALAKQRVEESIKKLDEVFEEA